MVDNFTVERYRPPSRDYLNKERADWRRMISVFVSLQKMQSRDIQIDYGLLDEISVRVHQRMNYYLFFHDKDLAQSRQAAIKAYWLLRYRPLHPLSKALWDKDYDINVYLAFFILFAEAISGFLADYPKEIQAAVVNTILVEYQDEYIRALSEYDISKEAMMLIADSLRSIVKGEIKTHT